MSDHLVYHLWMLLYSLALYFYFFKGDNSPVGSVCFGSIFPTRFKMNCRMYRFVQ